MNGKGEGSGSTWKYDGKFFAIYHHPEIVEVSRIYPARATIQSIPQSSSGRRHQDLILLDVKPNRHHHINGKKVSVYDELQLLKQSPWRTFAVLLRTSSIKDVSALAQLCGEAGLGFHNWSNAARFFSPSLHPIVSEYFDHTIFGRLERDAFLVALASPSESAIVKVLQVGKLFHCILTPGWSAYFRG